MTNLNSSDRQITRGDMKSECDSIAILVVETWNQGNGSGERLRLEIAPQRLASLIALDNPSSTEVSDLMQILVWQISLKWLFKLKVNSSYRLKHPRRLVDPLKPFGVLLCSVLNLTEYLSAYKLYQSDYTALLAFAPVAIELFTLCHTLPQGKEAKVKELRLIVKALRNNERPFDEQQFPTLFNWWEAIRPCASNPNYPNFAGKFLFRTKAKPAELGLIPALKGWIEALHENEPLVHVKADINYLLFQEGRGRPLRVNPKFVKNFSVSEILI